MPLLSPAGKNKVRQTRVSLCECGIGGKYSNSLGATETWNRGNLCREEKHLEKIKTRLLALKLKSFHRGTFESFLKAECHVWKSMQFGMVHFLGVRL